MASSRLGRVVLVLVLAAEAAVAQQYLISTVAGGAPTPTPVNALSAALQPLGVAAGTAGSVYLISDQSIFKIDGNGVLARVAGIGRRGHSGDGGPALNAQLFTPSAIAVGTSGDLYLAESAHGRIRKVTSDGTITTIAGALYNGYSGDGGPASSAQFSAPVALALNGAGALYIADSGNHRIRGISTDGTIQTVAGNGLSGNSGDGGPATQAALGATDFSIRGLAVDANGALYIAVDSVVRRVSVDGIIATVAGSGVYGAAGNGGPAVNAQLMVASAVAIDSVGNIYIADYGIAAYEGARIRRVSAAGIITTIAGTSPAGFSGDGGPAVSAQLSEPFGLALDSRGNLIVADYGNNRLRRVSLQGTIDTVGGNGLAYYLGDGGPATGAQFSMPVFVAADSTNNLLISDLTGQRVRKVSASGLIATVAGVGPPIITRAVLDGLPAISVKIGRPGGSVPDNKGNVFFADTDNLCVWKVSPTGLITRVAGNTYQAYGGYGDGGPALTAGFVTPWGLALDSTGNLYIADENDHRIRKISTSGIISTVAGNGIPAFSGDGGQATAASLNGPGAVAVDSKGNLYIADRNNSRIRKVSPNGLITTVAGDGMISFGDVEGPATQAAIGPISGLGLDAMGNLYISDAWRVHRVTPDGVLKTIAESLNIDNDYSGDGGPAMEANFEADGLAVGTDGSVYVADGYNGAVRVLQPVGPLAAVNSASGAGDAIAPGEIVTLYGSGIGPDQLVAAAPGGDGLYDAELAGTVVAVNGIVAPLIYCSTTQTSAVVPYGVTGPSAQVTVSYNGSPVAAVSVPVAPAAPGIFTADSSGKGQSAAINPDGSLNGPSEPAKVGDVILIFATGEGQTSPPGVDGKPAAATLPQPVLAVTALIGGQAARVLYAGGAPDEVAGIMQVNIQIPPGVPPGTAVPIVLQVGSVRSQSGVTIAVR